LAGLLLLGVGAFIRWSPWVEELQLKRASLPVLQNWALTDPSNPRVQYYLGTQAFNHGDLPEALRAFQRAAALEPKRARPLIGLALVQNSLTRAQEAQESARQATRLEPKSAEAAFTLAYVTYNTSRTQARLEFERVTRLAPKRADAWHWLGVCSMDLNDPSTALAPLQKAVQLQPKDAVYQRDLGQVLLTLSRFDEAHGHLASAVAAAPSDPEALYLLGRWQATTAKNDEELANAANLMYQSIQLMRSQEKPDNVNIAAVEYEMGEVLRQMKKYKEALQVYQDARKRDPRNLQILHHLALTLRDVGRTAEAKQMLDAYSKKSEAQDALNNLVQRVKQDGRNAALRLRLARILAETGDLLRAVNQYDVCLYLDPKMTVAKTERAGLIKRAQAESVKLPSPDKQGSAPVPSVTAPP
jgi:tetratricopeptide (TPR) repeat protein